MPEPVNKNLRETIRQEIINRYNLNTSVAEALNEYWEEFSLHLFLESDEQKLLDNLLDFLVSLSEGTESAEKKILREKKSRQRAEARQQQMNIFRNDDVISAGH